MTSPTLRSPGCAHVIVRRISFGDGVGGLERAAQAHVTAMLDAGVPICLHAAEVLGEAPAAVRLHEVPWPGPGRARGGGPAFGWAYRRWTTDVASSLLTCWESNDVLHFHGASVGALRHIGHRPMAPVSLANPHGMEELVRTRNPLRALNRHFLSRELRGGLRLAGVVVATDEALRRPIEMLTDGTDARVVVIPNAVDVDHLRSMADGAEVPLERPPGINLVTVGRLVHNKGYDLLADALAAWPHSPSAGPAVTWRHYGDGPMAHTLRRTMAGSPGVALELIPRAPDAVVQRALRSADVFVQPSRYEGSSLTTLEAMAQGCLVLATPVGGIPDKIQSGHNGILTDRASADELRRGLQAALAADSAALGQAALETVRTTFDWRSTSVQYVQAYAQMLEATRG